MFLLKQFKKVWIFFSYLALKNHFKENLRKLYNPAFNLYIILNNNVGYSVTIDCSKHALEKKFVNYLKKKERDRFINYELHDSLHTQAFTDFLNSEIMEHMEYDICTRVSPDDHAIEPTVILRSGFGFPLATVTFKPEAIIRNENSRSQSTI